MVDVAVRTCGCKSSVYGVCLLYRAIRVDMGYVNFACLRRNEWSGPGITDGCHWPIDESCPRNHNSSSSKPKRVRCHWDYVVRCRTIEIMQLGLYERGNAAALRGFCTLRKYLYNMVVGFQLRLS